MDSYMRGRAEGEARRREQALQQEAAAYQKALDLRASQKGEVARMIAAGNCDGAKNFALQLGDLDLAEQAVRLCTPKKFGIEEAIAAAAQSTPADQR